MKSTLSDMTTHYLAMTDIEELSAEDYSYFLGHGDPETEEERILKMLVDFTVNM